MGVCRSGKTSLFPASSFQQQITESVFDESLNESSKVVDQVERSSFEKEKLELEAMRADLMRQQNELAEKVRLGEEKRDHLFLEQNELLRQQLARGQMDSTQERQATLRSLLDEDMLEKERKKPNQRS